jgi:UDP-2-acetamido-2,6-beta-L-arabino-hexul-4-ose reductase
MLRSEPMRVLITGSNGFVGKNLQSRLSINKDLQVVCFTRSTDVAQLPRMLQGVNFVIHLAGVNRPQDPHEFITGNLDLTQHLCDAVGSIAEATGQSVPIIYTSSTQVGRNNPYGNSKQGAENALLQLSRDYQVPVHIFRLPNVFGKWCKPNYNSVVATFCHNIARGLPIQVNDPSAPITLVYVQDVVERFAQLMNGAEAGTESHTFASIEPQYTITVGNLARLLKTFKTLSITPMPDYLSTGLERALYDTYLSYLPLTK